MKYFININNNKVNGISQINNSRFSNDNNFQIEINEEIYNKILNGEIYKYENGLIIEDIEFTRNTKIKKRNRK